MFFPGNCALWPTVNLEPNELSEVVLLTEARNSLLLMLGEPTSEMVCNARVEDAGFSREHIHVENPVCARLHESGVYDSGKGKEQRNS